MSKVAESRTTSTYVKYSAIRQRFGIGNTKLLRLVMLGKVMARLLPGEAPRYCLEDVARIIREIAGD
jgi:hypothetical protein